MFAIASVLSVLSAFASVSATTPPAYAPTYGGYGGYGGYEGYTPMHMPGDGAGCARRWEGCGSERNGTTCCVGFNACIPQNEFFNMCVPLDPMPDGYIAEFGHCEPDSWPCEPLTQCKKVPGPGNVSLCLDPVHERKKQRDCSKADRYSQCGGRSWTGPQTCRGQNYCKYVNDWWSMCSPLKNATDAGCAEIYGACGGKEYKGPGCCADGLKCNYVNEWYSQCQSDV
jgi:Fungal cellulose binding domain